MKFGFAYTYPYRINNELPVAKTPLHARIRAGFLGLISGDQKEKP